MITQNNPSPASPTPMLIPSKAQEGIIAFFRECSQLATLQWNIREQLREIDLQYIREKNMTAEHVRAQLSNRYNDPTKYQDITVPVVMPAVEAAVAFQAEVFLSGAPLFPVVSDPQYIAQALQLEAIIDSQSTRGGWSRHLMQVFRDGFKYNLGAAEVTWCIEKIVSFDTDVKSAKAKQKELFWSGNKIKHLDMYNTFWDTRYNVVDVPAQGEFVGYTEIKSRSDLKTYIASLPDKLDNVKKAFESGTGVAGASFDQSSISRYYLPDINPHAILDKHPKTFATNWLAWAGISGADKTSTIAYRNVYELTTLYGRIIPSDFGLKVPGANHPQIWKFIIVNGQVLIYAERQTNSHNLFPILFLQPNDDGLRYQTKSLAQNVQPVQELTSAMMTSVTMARRRAISDRTIYDPSRIAESHINSDNPSAKIPVRPSAYGKNIAESVYAFPFRDDQSQYILQTMPFFLGLADKVTNQNPARQGQFVKGNKSRKEFEDTMDNATNPDQMVSILIEAQFFTPMKEMLKSNVLQYMPAGDIYSTTAKQTLQIDPIALRQAQLQFKLADGQTPASKLMNDDTWQVAVQTALSSPAIEQGINVAPMFIYLMKTRGADISAFEKSPQQIAYEQAMTAWQQTAQLAVEKGMQFNTPQPIPQQYGYTPGQLGNTAASQVQTTGTPNGPTNQ